MSMRINVRTVLLSMMTVTMLAGSAPAASAITLGQGGLLGLFGTRDGTANSDVSGPDSTGLAGFIGAPQSGPGFLTALG